MIRDVNSRLFDSRLMSRKKKRKEEERLNLGVDCYSSNPGPGTYETTSNPLDDTIKITIKEKFPIRVEDPTQNVEYYNPPAMTIQRKTIGSRGSLTYFDKSDTPFYAPVYPSTLTNSKYAKIHEKLPEKDPNSDIPGPGQYSPMTVSTRIKTSMAKSRPRAPLWEGDNGVPGPGQYNVTKSYPKPVNWTEHLWHTKPVQPVHYLKRQPPGAQRKTSFRPIQL